MNPRQPGGPAWIGVLDRIYACALWLYPRRHRAAWGEVMRQAFRDRCREAAREGRGPFNVLFAELVPDLATTVGVEHFDAIRAEANPMKRLLFVLIATFALVLLLHPDVSPALDRAQSWWRHRQELAWDRAYSAHLEALAGATEHQRRDSRDDVVAAMLYRDAAAADSCCGTDAMAAAISAERQSALQGRADAAFTRALAAHDRLALWLAVRACPARAAVCKPDASLAELERTDAGNSAVWALDLAAATASHDAVRARTALAQIARASRYDTQDATMMRALLAAFDRRPVPASLAGEQPAEGADPAAELASRLADFGNASHGYLFDEFRELKPFSDFCRSSDPVAFAERRADCRAAGLVMVRQGDTHFGYFAWIRNADPGEAAAAREAFRVHSWRAWGHVQAQRIDLTPQRWRAIWTGEGQRFGSANIRAQPPASFQLRPEQFDPWY